VRRTAWLLILGATLLGSRAEEGARSYEPSQFFRTRILPILEHRCFECHSSAHEIEGGLSSDSQLGWEKGGDNGPAVTPRDLKNSLLIQAIRHLDSESAMPPKKKLQPIEIALLETWVLLGAPDPRSKSN
jgi:mono/diheme cytochrome c family protein